MSTLRDITLNYEYLTEQSDVARVRSWLEGKSFFTVDTETTGVNPFRDDIVLMQVGNHEKQWLLDARVINIDELRPYIESPNIVKLGQNLQFDAKFFMRRGWTIRNVADTMLAEQLIRCGLGYRVGLGELVHHYLRLKIPKDKELRTSFGHTPVGAFSEEQLRYAAGDCVYPVYVAKHQKPLIAARGLKSTLSLEHAVLPTIARMEMEGLLIDSQKWTKLHDEAVLERDIAEKALDKYFGVRRYHQEDMFGEGELVGQVNYNSPKQILEVFRRNGFVLEDTDSETIALMAIHGVLPKEVAYAMIAYRIYNTRVTRYGLNFLEHIEPATGRIHSNFTQAFTTTGRLSSLNPNVQNVPRDPRYRNCFIPPEGYKYIIYDFKAIEPRILGDMSLDPTYIRAFTSNEDIYGIVGSGIYGEEVSKARGRPSELRSKSKIGVLGTSYGTGKPKFHRKMLLDLNRDEEGFLAKEFVSISREESDALWEGIFRVCPSIRASLDHSSALADPIKSKRRVWDDKTALESFGMVVERLTEVLEGDPVLAGNQEELERIASNRAKSRAYITYSATLGGRKRFFKAYHKSWWTDGRNHPIQGTASDIIKTAMVDIAVEIERRQDDAVIVNQAHDELILQVRADQAEQVNVYTKDLMEKAGNKFLRVVPCVAEGGIKECWEKD